MQTILLHKSGKRISPLQKGLRYENINVASKPWTASKDFDRAVLDTDIVLLHCTTHDAEIINILPELRRRKYLMPIVVIDDAGDPERSKKAKMLGADLYFGKPFSFRSMAIQLKNLLSKKEGMNSNKWLRAFDVWLNLEYRMVKRKKRIIRLRNKEFSLLEFFIINRGKLLTRTSILEHVWDRNARFSSNTVDVHINRLRKKIDDPFQNKLIHTVHCMGYIFDKKKK